MTLSIEVDQLTLRYGETTALDGLSFGLDGGRIYGLLGRNGAGKSSLLSVLAAFRKPTSGEVRIDGEPVFENPRITREICLIREAGEGVQKDESVETTLSLAAYIRPNWDEAYARRLIERFEIPVKKKAGQLSLGKRSALGVTLGLATRAPVTMFDESYLGMDAPSRAIFYEELLTDFIKQPRTIILSTHLIEEVHSLFEQVVIIHDGKLLLREDADTLRGRGSVITGPAAAVDRVIDGLDVLGVKELGRTKAVTVYGDLDAQRRRLADEHHLDLQPIALQDLFIHLTSRTGAA